MLKQFLAVTRITLRSVPERLGASAVIVLGIGGVVAVVVSLMAMADGFERTLTTTGSDDRALVLRAGSTAEINGNIPLSNYDIVGRLPQVARDESGPVASRETFVTVDMPRRHEAVGHPQTASLPMRGVNEASYRVRPEVRIVDGRLPESGKFELLAGRSVALRFAGFATGESVRIRGVEWRVVGLFSANGGAYESEVWVDERLLAQSWQRGETFSSMLVRLNASADFEQFQQALADERRLTVHAIRESDYYANQAQGTTTLIKTVGTLVAVIMSIGVVISALNTMFTALASRGTEIATYRALGYRRSAILGAVLVESTVLGLVGALAAMGCVLLFLGGTQLSTVAATSTAPTQVIFDFKMSFDAISVGLMVAVALGLVGGLIPALKAVRLPVTQGLRGT